jgi:hypothetical protein
MTAAPPMAAEVVWDWRSVERSWLRMAGRWWPRRMRERAASVILRSSTDHPEVALDPVGRPCRVRCSASAARMGRRGRSMSTCVRLLTDFGGDLACSDGHSELLVGRQCLPQKVASCFAVSGRTQHQKNSSMIGLRVRAPGQGAYPIVRFR